MIQGTIFIGAIIIAVTQFFKLVSASSEKMVTISGWLTIPVAVVTGVLVALLDTHIGVVDISVAQGIIIALGAVGVHTTVGQIG
jgi:hypothetical protein